MIQAYVINLHLLHYYQKGTIQNKRKSYFCLQMVDSHILANVEGKVIVWRESLLERTNRKTDIKNINYVLLVTIIIMPQTNNVSGKNIQILIYVQTSLGCFRDDWFPVLLS